MLSPNFLNAPSACQIWTIVRERLWCSTLATIAYVSTTSTRAVATWYSWASMCTA
jgi:hypothetical protein